MVKLEHLVNTMVYMWLIWLGIDVVWYIIIEKSIEKFLDAFINLISIAIFCFFLWINLR